VLRATTPCTFSTSQLTKVLRTHQFLTHFTSKSSSRHNAVHFFNISTSKSGPTLRITDGRAKPLMDRQVVEVSSLSLSFSFPDYLPTYLPTYLSIYLSMYLSIYLSTYLSIYLANYLSMIISFFLSSFLPFLISSFLPFFLSFFLFFLSFFLSLSLSLYLSISISLSICLSSVCLLSVFLSVCLSIYLSISLSLCVCMSVYLSTCKLENEAILRDLLNFWTWQHPKRSNSGRIPPFLNLTTSKRKQFCETSSIFEMDNIKKSNSARLPSKIESWVQCEWPRTNAFCDFFTPPV